MELHDALGLQIKSSSPLAPKSRKRARFSKTSRQQLTCEQCTYLNPGTATKCEMCEAVLRFQCQECLKSFKTLAGRSIHEAWHKKRRKVQAEREERKRLKRASKGVPSSYFLFSRDTRAEVKKDHPDWKSPEIRIELRRRWTNLGEIGQAPYKQKRKELKIARESENKDGERVRESGKDKNKDQKEEKEQKEQKQQDQKEKDSAGKEVKEGKDHASAPPTKTDGECVVCLEKPCETVFVPCGHLVACQPCANRVRQKDGKCPSCRVHIDKVIKVFKA